MASRENTLLHRVIRIKLEQATNRITILLGVVVPDERTKFLPHRILRFRNVIEICDAGAICSEYRYADSAFGNLRPESLPKLCARIGTSRFRCMKENLHLSVNRLAIVMHHRMQEVAEAIFVVTQLFKKLLLFCDERFSGNHRSSPLSLFMILGGKDGGMLDFVEAVLKRREAKGNNSSLFVAFYNMFLLFLGGLRSRVIPRLARGKV